MSFNVGRGESALYSEDQTGTINSSGILAELRKHGRWCAELPLLRSVEVNSRADCR